MNLEAKLADTFTTLVKIDSESKNEARASLAIQKMLAPFQAKCLIDNAGEALGGNTGNLVAKIDGQLDIPPMLIASHMDTVKPGIGVKPVLTDGVFTSDGTTILGADDKSAVAIMITLLEVLKDENIAHGPLEMLFTICEEIGLQGAKVMDYSLIDAKFGFALDASDINAIVTRAPFADHIKYTVHGKSAHAGAEPEKGLNAIWLAAKAIAQLDLGRIDDETTCNIGIIEGGMATNIVPATVVIKGEARSHSEEKLNNLTKKMNDTFENIIKAHQNEDDPESPRVEISITREFHGLKIPDDHFVVTLAKESAARLGREMQIKSSGGGSDSNVFFEKGIHCAVLGTGMQDMHSVKENIRVKDMADTVLLLKEIIKMYSQKRS